MFYDSLLSTPSYIAKERTFPEALRERLPLASDDDDGTMAVRFVNVGGRNNERRGARHRLSASSSSSSSSSKGGGEESTSYRNEAEAEEIVSLLKSLLRGRRSGGAGAGDGADSRAIARPSSIGIVTPYLAQVSLLKSLLAADSEYRSLLAAYDPPSTSSRRPAPAPPPRRGQVDRRLSGEGTRSHHILGRAFQQERRDRLPRGLA